MSGYPGRLKFLLLAAFVMAACSCDRAPLTPAQHVALAESHFHSAVAGYRQRISRGEHADEAYLNLGRLYYDRGAFSDAREAFAASGLPDAKKYLALSYHAMGMYTDALKLFDSHAFDDDEYRYAHGLTAEELNLYDRALKEYRSVSSGAWRARAQERIEAIERRVGGGSITDVDPSLAAALAAAPPADQYPQAGALILSCDEKIDITREGTEESTLHYVVKILNDRGKEDFSETLISYDSTYEKVELVYARTIKPDGTVVNVGSKHIRDVSKYLNYPLYSNVRVFIISFPEITDGSVIDYAVRIHNNQLINKKDFVMNYPVQSTEPILSARFTVTVPADRKIAVRKLNVPYNTFNASMDPQREERDGIAVYRWQFKDIPQIIPEPEMPPECEINPTILISSFASWDEIYGWWWNLARDKIVADDTIRREVVSLTARAGTDEEKASALYAFCARRIRYVAVEYGQAGYEPHFAYDIMRNKYGDCKDQSILLITMLKEAGIDAWPVLIPTRDSYNLDESFPSMLFNHCIVAARLGDRTVFMDPTAETCSFGDLPAGDQNRNVLIFTPEKYLIEQTPLFPASRNTARQRLRLALNPDESVSGEKIVETSGIYDQAQRYWFLYTQPELVEQTLKTKVQDISVGGSLSSYAIENLQDLQAPVVLRYSFSGPEYLTSAGPLRLMPRLAYFDASIVAQDQRRYPIDSGILDTKEQESRIELPAGMTVRYLPSSTHEDNQWFSFDVGYDQEKNTIRFSQRLVLKATTIPVEDYGTFKLLCEKLAKTVKQSIVLEQR